MSIQDSSSPFGWDLLYSSVSKDVKNNADVLVCFTHYVLITKGFKCIGIGDDKVLDGNEIQSEKLPLGWNTGYALRYVREGKLYHLRATLVEDTVQINLIRLDERRVSLIALNLRMVLRRKGPIEDMMPNYAEIRGCIETQLIAPVITSEKSKTQQTQTIRVQQSQASAASTVSSMSSSVPSACFPGRYQEPEPFRPTSPLLEPQRPLAGIGRTDLDPFFGGARPLGPVGGVPGPGGGMLFPAPRGDPRGISGPENRNPLGTGGVSPLAVPPGSRFDPLYPIEPDGNQRVPRNPGPDDFPPPEFGNMFM